MSHVTIALTVIKDEEGNHRLQAEYMNDDCESNIVDAWGKQAMLYTHQAMNSFSELKIDPNLWMIDQGCSILIRDHADDLEGCIAYEDYEDEDYSYEPITVTQNDRMRIKVSLDAYRNSQLIGGFATPSVQFAGIITEALDIALKEVAA